jgi:hypothetical protein
MKRWITSVLRSAAVFGVVGSAICAFGVYAQDQPQNPQEEENGKPKPAAHAPLIDTNEQDTTQDQNALTPDT